MALRQTRSVNSPEGLRGALVRAEEQQLAAESGWAAAGASVAPHFAPLVLVCRGIIAHGSADPMHEVNEAQHSSGCVGRDGKAVCTLPPSSPHMTVN